jgi:FG-GAP repeat
MASTSNLTLSEQCKALFKVYCPWTVSPTGPLASTVIAADFNGDGKLDLVTMEFRFATEFGTLQTWPFFLAMAMVHLKPPS